MLNQILQILLLCFAAIILTTGIALSSPLPSNSLISEHTPDHEVADPFGVLEPSIQPDSPTQPTRFPQVDTPRSEQPVLKSNRDAKQVVPQTNPSAPYDPYDYDAIRAMNREIYGEVRTKK